MKAREKLENLTLLWILYCVVSTGLMFFVRGGFGFWNVTTSAIGLLIGVGINLLIGRALVRRNGFVRGLVITLSALGLGLSVIGIGKAILLFFATFAFGLFWPIAGLTVLIAMNVHSLRVLFSRDVRRYFG